MTGASGQEEGLGGQGTESPATKWQTRTPPRVTQAIRDLCGRVVEGRSPVFVRLAVEQDAALLDCFNNVRRKIERDGGDIQHGWAIWEWPGVLLEAEFHAVWRAPTNELVDITPKCDGEEEILFLPDDIRVFTGTAVDNVRHPAAEDWLLRDHIWALEQMNASEHMSEQWCFFAWCGGKILHAIINGANDDSNCVFCDSKRPYRDCCRKKLRAACRPDS